jgi:hypothetical protein
LWNATTAATACSGCPALNSGPWDACTPCAPASLCPGLLPLPLTRPPQLAARLNASALGFCTAGEAVGFFSATSPLGEEASGVAAVIKSVPLLLMAAVGGAMAVAVTLYCISARVRKASCSQRLLERFRNCDFFQMPTSGAPGSDVRLRPTALGGLFTMLAAVAFTCLVGWVLANYFTVNVGVTTTPDMLVGALGTVVRAYPWRAPLPRDAAQLRPPLPQGASLQLRLFGQSGLGCGRPTPARDGSLFSTAPGEGAPWQLGGAPEPLGCDAPAASAGTGSASPSGAPSAAPPFAAPAAQGDRLSMLTLSCVSCVLSAASFVQFYLPFTCQSFLLEALAVDATGDVRSFTFPMDLSVAVLSFSNTTASNATSAEGRFLSTASWGLAPSLTVIDDEAGNGARNAAGFRLSPGSAANTLTNPLTDNAGGGVLPIANVVVVRVALPLQSLYYRTRLSAKQSTTELISGIVGLVGSLGVFAVAYRFCKSARGTALGRLLLGPPKSEPPLTATDPAPADLGFANPLRARWAVRSLPLAEAEAGRRVTTAAAAVATATTAAAAAVARAAATTAAAAEREQSATAAANAATTAAAAAVARAAATTAAAAERERSALAAAWVEVEAGRAAAARAQAKALQREFHADTQGSLQHRMKALRTDTAVHEISERLIEGPRAQRHQSLQTGRTMELLQLHYDAQQRQQQQQQQQQWQQQQQYQQWQLEQGRLREEFPVQDLGAPATAVFSRRARHRTVEERAVYEAGYGAGGAGAEASPPRSPRTPRAEPKRGDGGTKRPDSRRKARD